MSRRGAALVLALSVLAALLFLALPFVFTQTASIAGARAAGWDQQARRQLAASEGEGLALACQAHPLRRGEASRAASALPHDIADLGRDVAVLDESPGRALLTILEPTESREQRGIALEDEEGKLDINSLGPEAWARLLAALQIPDPPTWRWAWGGGDPGSAVPLLQHGRWQPLPYGRLAIALVRHRLRLPAGRYTALEQLLEADPRRLRSDDAPFGAVEYGAGPRDPERFLPLITHTIPDWERQLFAAGGLLDRQGPYRDHPLTRLEFERLRPHLTVHALGQGRGGLADLGSVLAVSQLPAHNDYALASDLVAEGQALERLMPAWSWLVGVDEQGRIQRGRRHLDGLTVEAPRSPFAAPGRALAVEVPAWVNANTASQPVADALGFRRPAADAPFLALAELAPESWWPAAGQPLARRPPLAVLSLGTVAVEAAATVLAGEQIVAQHRRRSVWQTAPLAGTRAWGAQAELEALRRLGLASAMQSGPQPIARRDLPGSALAGAGWLTSAPLASFGTNPAVSSPRRASLPVDERLGPHGYRGPVSVPLATLLPTAGPSDELAPFQLSLRFILADAGKPAELLAVRPEGEQPQGEQARLRLRWQPDAGASGRGPVPGRLVLELANAAQPWDADHPWTMAADDPRTPELDERCRPGQASLAPRRPGPLGTEFHYRAELASGTVHLLQLWYAGMTPGMHGLAVDGIVGRDAIAAQAFARCGDRYAWPALRLAEDIPASDPSRDGGAALAQPGTIRLRAPPGLSLADILPARGLVRIDDEYFRYEGIAGDRLTGVRRAARQDVDPTATVRTLIRPGPPPEYRDDPDHARRWPVTQAHRAGALVLPGSWLTRCEARTDAERRWLRGGTVLAEPFHPEPVEEELDIGGWPVLGTQRMYPPEIPVRDPRWPERGILRFAVGVSEHKAAFRREGDRLRLDWRPPIASGSADGAAPLLPPAFTTRATLSVRLISLRVPDDADLTHTGEQLRFLPAGWLQLLDPASGRCEWIRYTGIAVRAAPCAVTGRFFVFDAGGEGLDGWAMDPYRTSPQPSVQPRGAFRTEWRRDPWPAGTQVLPVQTLQPDVRGLEPGDVCTIVPDAPLDVRPVQRIVRFAASDGLPPARDGTGYDLPPPYFAFTAPVPDALPDVSRRRPDGSIVPLGAQSILVGQGWRGADPSPVNAFQTRRGQGPRASAWGPAPQLVIGGEGVTVDDIVAGPLLTGAHGDGEAENGCRILDIRGAREQPADIPAAGAATFPLRVTSNAQVFARPYGLVDIGGEVFAYRRLDSQRADLIGRALLASAPRAQGLPPPSERSRFASGPDGPCHGLPLVPLPFGPVGELMGVGVLLPASAAATPVGARGALGQDAELCDRPYDTHRASALPANPAQRDGYQPQPLQAPVQLVHHPHDGTAEVLRFVRHPDLPQVITAPWLRGLYGTAPRAWTGAFGLPRPTRFGDPLPVWQPPEPGSGQLNPLVIGWWPSRAAPLADLGLSGRELDAQLRCRLYGWAGYALHLRDLMPEGAAVEVLELGGAGGLAARVLVPGPGGNALADWGTMPAQELGPGRQAVACDHPRHRAGGDGAELRLHWLPATTAGEWWQRWSANQGLAPKIGTVSLDVRASVRQLAVEAVR